METLQFRSITVKDGARLRRYYKNCNYGLCEYSVGTKLMWGRAMDAFWAEAGGCLLIRNKFGSELVFDYPVPGSKGDMDEALAAVETWCIDQGVPLVFSVVPEAMVFRLLSRYTYLQSSSVRTWRDYVYAAEDLRTFSGRRYSGQRNHINKFRAACPGAEFYVLTREDKALVDAFWAEYDKVFTKVTKTAIRELHCAKRMLHQMGRPWFRAGGMLWNGRLLSICLAEKCGDTLIIHVEKAVYSCDGIYPATVQAAAQAFSQDVKWINREDDAADAGLRTSKLQYHPSHIVPKYRLRIQNDLAVRVSEIPTLRTNRLTLDALTDADVESYYALCTNADRNRWWGYDDVSAVGDKISCHEVFLRIAQEDFENRRAINFAVRLEGKLIGEAVLYCFDYRSGAELGYRIAPEYAGHGYGTEAFSAVVNWALYDVHMNRVVAKCFKENVTAYKSLASCMCKNGEDDTYFYFQKLV